VRLVLSGIRGVTDISVAQTLLRQARLATTQYADPAWRESGFNLLAEALHDLMTEAEPGSDWQLTYAQAFVTVATSDEHVALVRGLLDGSAALDGLVVDTELRWFLLRRLVVRGAVGEAEIDAELRRDPTAAGERHAAAGRAAVPTPEAKASAWDRIIGGDLPNAVFRATLGGLVDTEDTGLLEPYVERYFGEVARIWSSWSSDMSSTFAESAYPFRVISQDTVDRTTAYLEAENPPAALRRLLVEGRDGVSRALRAQAKDRSAS
jgi:aminopeptidase N